MIAPIDLVVPLADVNPRSWHIKKMAKVLERQGQIEPLQVYKIVEHYFVFQDDPHGNDIVYAARQLGWPTLLIVEMRKYDG